MVAGVAELLLQNGTSRGDYMHIGISVFIVSNKCKFYVVNYSSNIEGYYVDIRNEKWGHKLDMGRNSFNKYLAGEPTDDPDKSPVCTGSGNQGKPPTRIICGKQMLVTIKNKYLTLCQKLLCKCIDFAHI